MKTYLDCIPCFLRQALEAARAATGDEAIQRKVLDSVAAMIPELPLDVTPPEIAQQTYRLVRRITGNSDPYERAKARDNQMVMDLYPRLKAAVAASQHPLLAACKLAIAGNSLDLGAPYSHSNFNLIIESVLDTPLAVDDYSEFRESIRNSARVLYLGDNAGEIVFDKLLIEELRRTGELEIDFVVRERPVINDATRHDALSIGLDQLAGIISSGSDAPATILSQCSSEMLALYHSADTIIAKGQGNYESLSGEHANIFFMLKAKCPVIAGLMNVDLGSAILMRQKADTGG